ncbi:hypothetical protein [Salinarimonas rosea]|uniref:hypothetical protein n=1 Tax=Salinarimonas rosea TaxID=552063 RepID=UPI000410C0E0|nr:hypothetical protein [Salinarimonas rosea]
MDGFGLPRPQGSGGGGAAYDDTELRNRVTTVENQAAANVDAIASLGDAIVPATAAEIRTGTAGTLVDADGLYAAAAALAISWGTPLVIDLASGRNFSVTLGGNTVLANPGSQRAGQSGLLLIKQDATGGRTLSFDTAWRPLDGVPSIPTTASSTTVLAYFVVAPGQIAIWSAGTYT